MSITLTIEWEDLGAVSVENGVPTFQPCGDEPAVYRLEFTTRTGTAVYVGEAIRLTDRFTSYATAVGPPGTDTRMNNRIRRVIASGGGVRAKRSTAMVEVDAKPFSLDLGNKLQRVFVEHAAVVEALAQGLQVLNGSGYPPAVPGDPLSGDPD